jgi:putrescine transport system ATP-binding protein
MTPATAIPAYLQIRDVVKDFGGGSVAVNHVSLDIQQGEIFALLGSSGCGKTTLLRMLAGFETPTAGTIVLDGQNLAGLPPYLRPINMMFQSYALFPHLTVWDNIAFGLKREGMRKEEIAQRVEAMLKLVQLQKYGKRKPHQLSGGQQQRVALARSLAKRPQLMLLDEPLGALDKKLREETQVELVNIIHEVGVTCVMVTHDQEEAMTMASRIAVMSEGKILQVGPPADIYETPATRFVADFIGNVNLMDGTVVVDEPDLVEIDCGFCRHRVGHGITGNVGMAVSVALRPEKIRLSLQKPEGEVNHVQGTVRDRSYFGSFTVYNLELGGGRRLKVSESNVDRHRTDAPGEGQVAWATWPDTAQVVLTQ